MPDRLITETETLNSTNTWHVHHMMCKEGKRTYRGRRKKGKKRKKEKERGEKGPMAADSFIPC